MLVAVFSSQSSYKVLEINKVNLCRKVILSAQEVQKVHEFKRAFVFIYHATLYVKKGWEISNIECLTNVMFKLTKCCKTFYRPYQSILAN